jgi:hypothetical protein
MEWGGSRWLHLSVTLEFKNNVKMKICFDVLEQETRNPPDQTLTKKTHPPPPTEKKG